MPLYEWDETYILGVREIDLQHRQLIEMINELYKEYKGGAAVPSLKSLLDVLMVHMTQHFVNEEQWMNDTSYPDLAEHQTEHARFRTRVAEVHKLFEQNIDISLDLMLLLNNWVRHHLLGTDGKFAKYIITGEHPGSGKISASQLHLTLKKYLS